MIDGVMSYAYDWHRVDPNSTLLVYDGGFSEALPLSQESTPGALNLCTAVSKCVYLGKSEKFCMQARIIDANAKL